VPSGPYTVADAMRDYIAWYAAHRKALREVSAAVNAHILPALGDKPVARLTTAAIERWLIDIANTPARLRSRKGKPTRHRPVAADAEGRRKRMVTANSILTLLKAALNRAWRAGRIADDGAWRKVRPFRNVDTPVVRYLSEIECKRLVNACPADFRQIVRAALLTGCRYAELASLTIADFNPDAGTLVIRTSKSGKVRHVVLTEEGQQLFAEATAGKATRDLIFGHNGAPWGKSHQHRFMRDACDAARIAPAISFHVLRHCHGAFLAMQGVPLPVIAKQLGHADTRITERHYAHLAPSYIADTIRASFPTLGILEPGKIARLAIKRT